MTQNALGWRGLGGDRLLLNRTCFCSFRVVQIQQSRLLAGFLDIPVSRGIWLQGRYFSGSNGAELLLVLRMPQLVTVSCVYTVDVCLKYFIYTGSPCRSPRDIAV